MSCISISASILRGVGKMIFGNKGSVYCKISMYMSIYESDGAFIWLTRVGFRR